MSWKIGHNFLEKRFLGPVGEQKSSNLSMFPSRNHRPIIATNQSGNQIVCFTAVLCVLTQRSSTHTAAENRTTFLSAYYPIRFQLPFSGRSHHVYTTVTPPSQLCSSRGSQWVKDRTIKTVKTSSQRVVLSHLSPIQNLQCMR